ncbi:tumor necrosis factor receptor superfamily member 5-like isoform X1 [Epinephelus fuscoguttatus]|uniref:tumor necrosis factor receptor superfamily member 5-like isoform X1 n=1 Tax=Epinephelus fuscoguttatus TaxID=293821 RepID=UPI0020D1961B|nr:tumor necrosis factor receptor superfamily member 5-like isoform X1 [Epinephelus fuscoguttatus]
MIPLSSPLAALCLLIIWTIGRAAGCRDGQDEVDGRCCDLCPPGKYMTEFCSEHKQTVCRPCKEGYFADQSNMFDRCEKCRTCQQKYAEKCTPTANANCSCLPGFLCSNNVCSKCEENKCVSGEKPMRTASVQSDGLIEYSYQCEPLCTDNTRFNEKEGICETHREGRDSINLILGISFVLLSLILLVFLSNAFIKTLRKHKTYKTPVEAISTNATDFHLSKEESGVTFIMQDETKQSNSLSLMDLEKVSSCYCSGVPEQGT